MGAAAPIAAGASIASLGLSAFGAVSQGQATNAADQMKAEQAEQAAQFGQLQATMNDTAIRERLNTQLGNIESITAAAHTNPTSPSTIAVEGFQSELSERQRLASDVTLRSQAAADTASADYLTAAGNYAVTQSYVTAAGDVLGGAAKGFAPGGPFTLGA